jgi:hypothetical protein
MEETKMIPATAATQTNSAIETQGGDINWRSINESRNTDFALETLFKEAELTIFNEEDKKEIALENKDILLQYIEAFNKHLLTSSTKKFSFQFTIPEIRVEKTIDKKKGGGGGKHSKTESKADVIRRQNEENKNKKTIELFLLSLKIKDHYPILNSNMYESFLCIVNWTVYLIIKKNESIEPENYFNCAISLYRSLEHLLENMDDKKEFIMKLKESLKIETYYLLDMIQLIMNDKKSGNLFDFLLKNSGMILDSFWDKVKPVKVSLYSEQKQIVRLVKENMDKKLLVFFEMPPANGKTVLSTILAKMISNENKKRVSLDPTYKKKTVLYICYNSIVRDEVARLCITHNVDVRFWMAISKIDKEDRKVKTFLRPYQNCYQSWNQRKQRTKKEDEWYQKSKISKYSENLHEQWNFAMTETLSICDQEWNKHLNDIKTQQFDYMDQNLPEMIISDLESAYELLTQFPDIFITYFDETFALANLKITSKIMNVTGFTLFVSATLAKPEEIPSVISDFKKRHDHTNDDFLHVIRSTKQHIGCSFIDEAGYLYPAHKYIEKIEDLPGFIEKMDKTPLLSRSYSPEIVFHMLKILNVSLDSKIKFETKFHYYGQLTHQDLRKYAIELLQYIVETENVELFALLKTLSVKKIENMDVNSLFTKSAINYQKDKFLHISSDENFHDHLKILTHEFLSGSPKIDNLLNKYDQQLISLKKQIESLQKGKDGKDIEYKIGEIQKQLGEVSIEWPKEFIFNSTAHASKYGNGSLLKQPNKIVLAKRSDFGFMNDQKEKLLFSGIGIYDPESFHFDEMQHFLEKKDLFNGILSNPAIVYGTNISLSVVDIDESFIRNSTKNVLYQLVGRAGRMGKSTSATILFRNNAILKIIMEESDKNLEAEQVERNYQELLQK